MCKYDLTEAEDLRLRFSIMLPSRSLYEYLVELPLGDLKAYPKKGYRWWMGRAARSAQALFLRDYILHWRLEALAFRQAHPRVQLEALSQDELQTFLHTYLQKTPVWAYHEPIRDVIQLLHHPAKP